MNLSKRKYKKIEVETLLDNLSSDFNLIINKQKLEIKNLTDEKTKLIAEIELYKEKEDAIKKRFILHRFETEEGCWSVKIAFFKNPCYVVAEGERSANK